MPKLSDEEVMQMRHAADAGVPITEVAERYGCSYKVARRAIIGETYAHVGGPLQDVGGDRTGSRLLSDSEVIAIREAAAAGESLSSIAMRTQRDHATVRNIVRGISYTEIPGPITADTVRGRPQKLSEADVTQIRKAVASGVAKSTLADEYGVHVRTIRRACADMQPVDFAKANARLRAIIAQMLGCEVSDCPDLEELERELAMKTSD